MFAIYKREFKSFMRNVTGSLFMFVFLLFSGAFVFITCFLGRSPSINTALEFQQFVLIISIPVITMKSLIDGRTTGTDKLLFSLPLRTFDIVLGKFFATATVFAIPVAVLGIVPVLLGTFGRVYYATGYSALFGLFLLGLAVISVCMFISSLTSNLVVSAILSVGVAAVLYFLPAVAAALPDDPAVSLAMFILLGALFGAAFWLISKNYAVGICSFGVFILPFVIIFLVKPSLFAGLFASFIVNTSVFVRFSRMAQGVFDLGGVIYLLSVAVFFIFCSMVSVERRRRC